MATMTREYTAMQTQPRASRLGFLPQVWLMTRRNLLTIIRNPAALFPGIFISVFLLIIYEASLGGAAGFLPQLSGTAYISFILPLSILSSSLSGANITGENLVRDLENGYFDKLMLTPISRGALLLGAILSGGLLLGVQALVVMIVGLFLGLESETGVPGLMAVLLISTIAGISFCGFSVGVALRTENAAATQGAGFIIFPLTFLTASWVPLELLDGWIKTAAQLNPVTYMLNGTRAILIEGWEMEPILQGLAACVLLAIATYAFALTSLHARTSRK